MNADQLLGLSDERDMWERRLLDAERAAYSRGFADGCEAERIEAGRAWAALPAQRIPYGPPLAEAEAARWTVRGEQRTRETFGQPHPADYKGQRQERAA